MMIVPLIRKGYSYFFIFLFANLNGQVLDPILVNIESALQSYNGEKAYHLIIDNKYNTQDSALFLKYEMYELSALEQMGLYDESIMLSNTLLSYPNLNNDQKAEIYLLRALVYEILNHLPKAKQSLDSARILVDRIKPKSMMRGRYYIRSSSYFKVKYDQTHNESHFNNYLNFVSKAMKFSVKYDYKNMIANANMLLSFNPKLSKIQKELYLIKALNWWKITGDIHGISAMYNNLAMLNLRNPKTAMKYNDSAILSLIGKDSPLSSAYTYKTRYKLFKSIENADSALVNYIKFKEYADSIDINRKLISIERIDQKTSLESKKLNTLFLKEAIAKEKRNNIILLIISIILIAFIMVFILLYLELSDRKKQLAKSRKTLSQNLEEKTLLLTELNHRVKNNLAMIISLIQLQNSKKSKLDIDQLEKRVNTMALAHNLFSYSNQHIKGSKIKLKDYLSVLKLSFDEISEKKIKFSLNVTTAEVSLENALPIGMIFNELVTNSIKHALVKGDNLTITFNVKLINGVFILYYSDNGEKFNEESEESTGMLILNVITKQLKGTLKRINSEYFITLHKKEKF